MSISTTPQKAKLYAIFDNPPAVFACRVNQSFPTHDMVYEFAFDGVSAGAYADVLPGMTILIGTSLGAHDKGITYCRKEFTSASAYCGETSEVEWADNLYITVLQDWAIWNEYLRIATDTTVYMKFDVPYIDQHTKMKPIPILGPDRVVRYTGSQVTVAFDGSGSFVIDATIAAHLFTCPGATVIGGTTSSPTIQIDTPGRYVVAYTVTSSLGVPNTTYRTIHVWSDQDYIIDGVTKPAFRVSDVTISSLAGDFDSGGWTFGLSVWNSPQEIRERSKVILFSEEWYGDTQISYGRAAGAENIVAIGWVSTEHVSVNEENGGFDINVQGPQYWLQQVYSFVPAGIEQSINAPTAWTQMNTVTVDKVLWNLFVWRTTVCNCVDVYLTGDTREALEFTASANSIWGQIKEISYNAILASPCCDRYGRLFVQTESVLLPASSRGSIPNIGTITYEDCESIDVDHVIVTPTSQVVLSGVSVSGTDGAAKFSMSRGHIPMHYGTPTKMERLLLSNQEQSNELAGNLLEKANSPYAFKFNNLLYNNRLVDICPNQFISAVINETTNPRGLSFTGNIIVRHVDISFDDGAWSISWDAVSETKSVLSMNGDIPTNPGDVAWTLPEYPPLEIPKMPSLDSFTVPTNPVAIRPIGILGFLFNSGGGLWVTDMLNAPGTWVNTTPSPDWPSGDLADLAYFELSASGIAYLASYHAVWSQLILGVASPRSVIMSYAQLQAMYPIVYGFFTPSIKAVGFDKTSLTNLVIQAGTGGSGPSSNGFCMLNTSGNSIGEVWNTANTGWSYSGNSISAYGGKWYYSGSWQNNALIARVTSGFTGWDMALNTFGYPYTDVLNVHADSADIMYTSKSPLGNSLTRYANLGTTPTLTTSALNIQQNLYVGYNQTLACDPTGQYIFAVSGGLKKSSNFGDTFTAAADFPSLSYDGRAPAGVELMVVINLGDANKWLVAYNAEVMLVEGVRQLFYLHVWYTDDFGLTWTDWAGNLHTETAVNTKSVRWMRNA